MQGVGEVQSHVRDVFSRLADLDDELDSLSPVGRDADSLASQAEAVKGFLSRLANLRAELEGHTTECTAMLRREGSSPDLLALRRETEALSRQAGKVSDVVKMRRPCFITLPFLHLVSCSLQLSERGQARLDQIDEAAGRVRDFYRLVAELQSLLGKAEEGLNMQGIVGTEVEMIKQQLQEFKVGLAGCFMNVWVVQTLIMWKQQIFIDPDCCELCHSISFPAFVLVPISVHNWLSQLDCVSKAMKGPRSLYSG